MAAYRRYVLRPARLQAKRRRISLWDAFPFLRVSAADRGDGFSGRRAADRGGRRTSRPRSRRLSVARRSRRHAAAAGPARTVPHGPRAPGRRAAADRRGRAGVPRGRRRSGRLRDWPKLLAPLPLDSIRSLHQLLWWVHALLAFGLIVSIPFTKAFHLISSPANMLFRHPTPPGRLPVVGRIGRAYRARLHVAAAAAGGRLHVVRQVPGGLPRLPHGLSAVAPRFRASRRTRSCCAHRAEGQRRNAQPARRSISAGGTLGLLHLPSLRGHLPGPRRSIRG